MKILGLAQKPQRRGAELTMALLQRYLGARGHAVSTAYLYPATPSNLPLGENDRLLPGREDHPLERGLGWNPALLRSLSETIERLEPDVVLANGARTLKYGALAARRSRDRRWALVYRAIGNPRDWVRGLRRRLFYRSIVMPMVDGIAAISQASLAALLDLYDVSVPAGVIPGMIDREALRPSTARPQLRASLETPEESPVILWAGSLSAEKRPDRFLRVVAEVAKRFPTLEVWVAGEGPLRERTEARIRELGPRPRVSCLGPRGDLASLMNAADVLVLTSDTEGMPGVVLEASYLGLPSVATDVGGTAECLLDGTTGLLFEPTDETAMVEGLNRLFENPKLLRELGRGARKLVEERFTLDRVGPAFEAFCAALVDPPAQAEDAELQP